MSKTTGIFKVSRKKDGYIEAQKTNSAWDKRPEYTCRLSDASTNKAKAELNEDPVNRMGAVETLRNWLKQNPHIIFPKDAKTLLMFLRHAKFSQLKARRTIEKFCTAKSLHQDIFSNLNPCDPMFEKYLRTGIWLVLPGRHPDGTKILLSRQGAFKPSEWKKFKLDWFRGTYILWHYILMDEENQVNGYQFLADFSNFTMAHQTFISIDEMSMMLKHFQHAFPLRYKGLHHYNCGAVFETMFSLMRPFMEEKFRSRVYMHGSNLEKVYNIIPMEMLPEEYLPDEYDGPTVGSIDQIIERMIKDFQQPEVVEYMKHMSDPRWGINESLKPSTKDTVPQESFRKLTW